ncbi:hypothetical protein GCM10007207_15430 [Asaia siamensis]|uniref:Uncharacterized protein n=1 Tax=Asaia siamensis TaxID=110479 RepID=A0ABQ1LXI3_9PROT|nr:hypothetical protein GCM10007207_15430 [Asaia siamensis]
MSPLDFLLEDIGSEPCQQAFERALRIKTQKAMTHDGLSLMLVKDDISATFEKDMPQRVVKFPAKCPEAFGRDIGRHKTHCAIDVATNGFGDDKAARINYRSDGYA